MAAVALTTTKKRGRISPLRRLPQALEHRVGVARFYYKVRAFAIAQDVHDAHI
jgi:hypothetical protein